MGGEAPRASWSNLLASSPLAVAGMGSSATAVEYLRSALFVDNTAGAGVAGVSSLITDPTSGFLQIPTSARIGDAAAATRMPAAGEFNFNETAWDRRRGNTEFAILASASRTATTTSAIFTSFNASRLIVILNCTVNPGGAETVSVGVRGYGTTASSVPMATAAANALGGAAGTYVFTLGPGAVTAWSGLPIAATSQVLVPRRWEVRITHSAAGAWTYSVDGILIL